MELVISFTCYSSHTMNDDADETAEVDGDSDECGNGGGKTTKGKRTKEKKTKKKVQVEQSMLLVDIPSEGGEETGSDSSVEY